MTGRHRAPAPRRRSAWLTAVVAGLLTVALAGVPGGWWAGNQGATGRAPSPVLLPSLSGASARDGSASGTLGGSGQSRAASGLPAVGEPDRVALAHEVLSRRERALRDKDKRAWMATVDPPDSEFGKRQSRAFDNLMALSVTRFDYQTPQSAGELPHERLSSLGAPAFVVQVNGVYSLAGFDRGVRQFTASLTFVRRGATWRIAGDTDGTTSSQLWDLEGLRVLRSPTSLVVGNAALERLRFYSDEAQAGVARVSDVWGRGWPGRVVLVVPATAAEFASILGQPVDASLSQVAAVTQGPLTPGGVAVADAVVVNPGMFDALKPLGRRVVVTHELTHVAVRSSTSGAVPLWLSEGFADYVGYRGLDLPATSVAAELLAQVRAGRGPQRLPVAADYDPSVTTIAPAYSASWLACAHLAQRFGEGALVEVYRAVAATTAAAGSAASVGRSRDPATGPAATDPAATDTATDAHTDTAFRATLGITLDDFVADWRGYLTTLAGAG